MRASTQAEFLYAALGYLGELGYDDAEEVLTVDEVPHYARRVQGGHG